MKQINTRNKMIPIEMDVAELILTLTSLLVSAGEYSIGHREYD